MNRMKILAFMQNMWVRDVARVEKAIAQNGEAYRLRLISFSLFNGCLTGKRLQKAFGEDLCDNIIWEESTRKIGDHASSVFPPDLDHMQKAINEHKPDVIITFGAVARGALKRCEFYGRHIPCVHPASRDPMTITKLAESAAKLRGLKF